ncbi:MAG: RhuM family protein [Sulfurimonas sp.]|nr:RhuM family protein [Sulfurimonas sp.]
MSDIIIYQNENGDIKVDVTFEDKSIWLSQKQMSDIFSKSVKTINEHISNIFLEKELSQDAVIRNFRITADDGKSYNVNHYNLDMIIAIGFRVKSPQGTQFRIWATKRLNEYITKGFVLNDERFKNGNSMNYFDELQTRLREIRISERFFYQKIKDIYMTSKDYDKEDEKTKLFFKIVQNKLLWAVSEQTAAELVHNRIDINLPQLGMNSLDKKSKNITKTDVSVAKNYLNEEEIKLLGLLVEQYLAFAETMAQQKKVMYMQDWIKKLDDVISLNGRELLTHAGKISHERMQEIASLEYEKYKTNQKELQRAESFKELEADLKALK